MRIKQFWALLIVFLLTIVALLLQKYVVNSNPVMMAQPTVGIEQTADVNADLPQPSPQVSLVIPTVEQERLMKHVKALAGERYQDDDRYRARQYIYQSLEESGWKPVFQVFQRGVNVFAERPGTDPKAGAILVAAHYDTVPFSPGADDNATGVAVVLEVARLLGSQPTPRTLQVALFDKEETGLHGSRAFTANDTQIAGLKGAVILDMVGYACHRRGCQKYPEGIPTDVLSDRGDFIAAIIDQENAAMLQPFRAETAKSFVGPMGLISTYQAAQADLPALATLEIPLKGLWVPDLLRSDHAPFWLRGIGAILLTDTANFRNPYYHQSSDRPGTIDQTFFTQVAQLIVKGTLHLLQ